MAENYNLSVIAAEYVLGTLDPIENAFVDKERRQNAGLNAEIEFWEENFLPLTEAVDEIDPPLQLWNKIEPLLIARAPAAPVAPAPPDSAAPPMKGKPTILPPEKPVLITDGSGKTNRPGRWKALALALGIVALLSLGGNFLLLSGFHVNKAALFAKRDQQPVFEIHFDPATAVLRAEFKGHDVPAGKAYQVWLIPDNNPAAPYVLGLMTAAEPALQADLSSLPETVLHQGSLTISVESSAGSVTGMPSDDIVLVGKLF